LGRRAAILRWGAVGAILLFAFAYFLWKARGNTFFFDEWNWIEWRRSGLHWIFASYNQHLMPVPIAVYQFLFHTVGIGHYRYYRVLPLVAHLACATAVFVFAWRRIGSLALLVLIPVALFGEGWEFILWGINLGATASIALCVFGLICLELEDRRGGPAACVLFTLGPLCSETALVFALGAAVEVTWRDRGFKRAWIWAVPVALYVAWWLAFYRPDSSAHDLGAIPKFVAQLAASAAGNIFGLSILAGWVVLAGVIALVGVMSVRRGFSPRMGGLLVTLLAYWALVAFGRAQLGVPGASRYVYPGVVLLLLLVLEALRGTRATLRSVGVVALLRAGACGKSACANSR
jgi:hypothetical protein